MTEIYLHGLAAHKFGELHKFVNINKPSDCFRAIDTNRPGFMQYFVKSAQDNIHYELIVDGQSLESINDGFYKKKITRIDIVPVIKGNVNFIIQVVVQVLIAAVVAGIQYLLTPIPESEPRAAISRVVPTSYMFSNRENLTEQYTSVPLGYGALRVGSKIIQSIIDPIDLSTRESRLGNDVTSQQLAGTVGSTVGGAGGAGGY